jgi:twitching motility protein PilT
MAELGLPTAMRALTMVHQGLILVTGPTGSGKSTTLASMVDAINSERACHILTIEDPIEYVHEHKRAIVNQREVGLDTASFSSALRAALRGDPDVLLIGEMRDLESIQTALSIAETGHLVLASLHTNDTSQSLARIIDVFPADQQAQVRTQLAAALTNHVPAASAPRRRLVAAHEVLIANTAVRNLIKEGKTHQLRTRSYRPARGTDLRAVAVDPVTTGVISYETRSPRPLPAMSGPGRRRRGCDEAHLRARHAATRPRPASRPRTVGGASNPFGRRLHVKPGGTHVSSCWPPASPEPTRWRRR